MSYAAKSSSQTETDVFEVSGSYNALAQLLDIHHEQSEISQRRWPIGRTILFASVVSVVLWVAVYWLIALL